MRFDWRAMFGPALTAATALLAINAPTNIRTTAHLGFTVPRLPDPSTRGPKTRGANEIWRQLNPITSARKLLLVKVISYHVSVRWNVAKTTSPMAPPATFIIRRMVRTRTSVDLGRSIGARS